MGFDAVAFRNALRDDDLQPKGLRYSRLADPHHSSLVPDVSHRRVPREGQNRDNFQKRHAGTSVVLATLFAALVGLAAVISGNTGESPSDVDPASDIVPPRKRRRRRDKRDRGLPSDTELTQLATAYLTTQGSLWPSLVAAGLLPKPDAATVHRMVAEFKERHRTGQVDPAQIARLREMKLKLAGGYSRFSCDRSKTTSNLDQMVRWLTRSTADGYFIPWCYVFADYSISGVDSSRQGYSSYKAILSAAEHAIQVTFIDDFTRASRDEIEWWTLASTCKRLRKGLIGASDNFDLSSPEAEIMITIYSLVSRLFLKGTREKSKRGMRGAHQRRTCLGKLPFGFTRSKSRDANGRIICNSVGKVVHVPCWDPETQEQARQIFRMFCVDLLSVAKIVRYCNAHRFGGWDGWTACGIKNILRNPAYIGVFIWNQTRREINPETNTYQVVKNPRSEWEIWTDRTLALIPMDWFRTSRRRLYEMRRNSPHTGKRKSRNEISATTLFSGTLRCGYCKEDTELTLTRSTAKHKQLGCPNGRARTHACQLNSSKSVRIIESCLLNFIRERFLTPAALETLVERANAFLATERKQPCTDVKPLLKEAASLKAKINKLSAVVEEEPEDSKDLIRRAYNPRIREHQRKLDEVSGTIAQIRRSEVPVPCPLDVAAVTAYLEEMRAVLNQATPAAADAIRKLTGPVKIRQEKVPGKKAGANWIAEFTPDFVGFLATFASHRGYPESITLGFLTNRNWITSETAVVPINDTYRYEKILTEVVQLRQSGQSVAAISRKVRADPETVLDALRAAGKSAQLAANSPQIRRQTRKCDAKCRRSIVKMKDELQLGWAEIGRRLDLDATRVRHIYLRECGGDKPGPARPHRPQLSAEKRAQMREMLGNGCSHKRIRAELGVGKNTVGREAKRMRTDAAAMEQIVLTDASRG